MPPSDPPSADQIPPPARPIEEESAASEEAVRGSEGLSGLFEELRRPVEPTPETIASTDALTELADLFLEMGLAVIALSVLARLAMRLGLSPIPFYLLAGLGVGVGGVASLPLSTGFLETGANIGVVLLLFMLGLEYSGAELRGGLQRGWKGGVINTVFNFTPGFVVGWMLGWGLLGALLLGGVTWNSSSGVIAKILSDLGRLGNRETPIVLSLLVFEDLAMAVYLPIIAVLLLGLGAVQGVISIGVALLAVTVVLLLALRFGNRLSDAVAHNSDEVVLLTVFGLVLMVAGLAQNLQVSSAIGAFLVGLALSGSVADKARQLLGPLRDFFAAIFFFFVGLQTDARALLPVLGLAIGLALATALTKWLTGVLATRAEGVGGRGQMRAGLTLVPRGEFAIVIAGLGAAAVPGLAPLTAAYVLLLAVAGSILPRYSDAISDRIEPIAARFFPASPDLGKPPMA